MPTTAYAMLRTDRSSAVCPSDLRRGVVDHRAACDVDEHACGSQRIGHRAVYDLVGGRPAGADGDQEVAVARHLHEVAVEAVGHILPAASVIGDFHVDGFGLAGDVLADSPETEDAEAAAAAGAGQLHRPQILRPSV